MKPHILEFKNRIRGYLLYRLENKGSSYLDYLHTVNSYEDGGETEDEIKRDNTYVERPTIVEPIEYNYAPREKSFKEMAEDSERRWKKYNRPVIGEGVTRDRNNLLTGLNNTVGTAAETAAILTTLPYAGYKMATKLGIQGYKPLAQLLSKQTLAGETIGAATDAFQMLSDPSVSNALELLLLGVASNYKYWDDPRKWVAVAASGLMSGYNRFFAKDSLNIQDNSDYDYEKPQPIPWDQYIRQLEIETTVRKSLEKSKNLLNLINK